MPPPSASWPSTSSGGSSTAPLAGAWPRTAGPCRPSAQQGSGGGGQAQLLWCAGDHGGQGGEHAVVPVAGAFGLVQVVAEVGWAEEAGEPHEDVLTGADRQPGESVLGVLCLQACQRRGACLDERRAGPAVEEVRECLVERLVTVVERDQDARRRGWGMTGRGPRGRRGREA